MRSTLAQHFPQGACGGHDLHAPLTAADHRRGALRAALDDEIYRHRIREHEDGRFKSHLHASPEFFVNGTLCDVSFELEHLESTVRAALGRD